MCNAFLNYDFGYLLQQTDDYILHPMDDRMSSKEDCNWPKFIDELATLCFFFRNTQLRN